MTLMGRYETLMLTTALGLALVAGVARAQDVGSDYAGQEIGTIRFIDRALNLIILTDGNEFRATDSRMLANLTEGELVKVDFTHENDRSIINSIEPADADSSLGASPTTEPGPHEH
jgi:hypothetical protein